MLCNGCKGNRCRACVNPQHTNPIAMVLLLMAIVVGGFGVATWLQVYIQ